MMRLHFLKTGKTFDNLCFDNLWQLLEAFANLWEILATFSTFLFLDALASHALIIVTHGPKL